MRPPRPALAFAALFLALLVLAWLRPLDHDESQYVAAAVLSGAGLLPYRDYAYLQTPLQPLLLAPLAAAAGMWAWPALRLANALFAGVAVAAAWRAMRVAGVGERTATTCAGLFATCDILLFAAGTARNDALPAALLALALAPILRAERGEGSCARAVLIGLLLAGAAAAKISYAFPAAAYGAYALFVRRHRPAWVAAGAVLPVAVVAWLWWLAPASAIYGILTFPAAAPSEYFLATGRGWRLSQWAKALDVVKFLALGPALLALGLVAGRRRPELLDWLVLAGLVAALLPTPTWRQYLLPLLPPLFVRLALLWQARPPGGKLRMALAVFVAAGIAPSAVALAQGGGMLRAVHEGERLAAAMNRAGVTGRVATLAPQFVPATGRAIDPRFATGPFHFRSRGLLSQAEELRLHLVSRDTLPLAPPPAAIVTGAEGSTSGDPALDAVMEHWARRSGWRAVPTGGRLRLYIPPAAARALPAISP